MTGKGGEGVTGRETDGEEDEEMGGGSGAAAMLERPGGLRSTGVVGVVFVWLVGGEGGEGARSVGGSGSGRVNGEEAERGGREAGSMGGGSAASEKEKRGFGEPEGGEAECDATTLQTEMGVEEGEAEGEETDATACKGGWRWSREGRGGRALRPELTPG